MIAERIQVLDKGYVRLADTNIVAPVMGSDLSPANAARTSFMKESPQLTAEDIRLLDFLAREAHTSPYRHAVVTMEVKAPFMVARQWMKYRTGWEHGPDSAELTGVCVPEELAPAFWSFMRENLEWIPRGEDQGFNDLLYARNEASRRYVTLEPEWYIPGAMDWRSAPENRKQGSGDLLRPEEGRWHTRKLQARIEQGLQDYNEALAAGLAPEQARGFLPNMYFMYTVWRWTASLQGFAHFINQRVKHDAQSEIRDYAYACWETVRPHFAYSLDKLINRG